MELVYRMNSNIFTTFVIFPDVVCFVFIHLIRQFKLKKILIIFCMDNNNRGIFVCNKIERKL